MSNSGLPDNHVTSIAIDASGSKWIGTYQGVAIFNENSDIKMKQGLAPNSLAPLCRNYPNPFKQKTSITYNVLENGLVSLRIYSLDGQLVKTLVNSHQARGCYTVAWDGANSRGRTTARGVYMYQLGCEGRTMFGKMDFVE